MNIPYTSIPKYVSPMSKMIFVVQSDAITRFGGVCWCHGQIAFVLGCSDGKNEGAYVGIRVGVSDGVTVGANVAITSGHQLITGLRLLAGLAVSLGTNWQGFLMPLKQNESSMYAEYGTKSGSWPANSSVTTPL